MAALIIIVFLLLCMILWGMYYIVELERENVKLRARIQVFENR